MVARSIYCAGMGAGSWGGTSELMRCAVCLATRVVKNGGTERERERDRDVHSYYYSQSPVGKGKAAEVKEKQEASTMTPCAM